MPIPKPRPRESKDNFISRCAEQMAEVDPNVPNDQRLAMCYSSWRSAQRERRRKRRSRKVGKR